MAKKLEEMTKEELNKRLSLIEEELDDLTTEFEYTFEAGHMHISPAQLELEKDALRRDNEKLSKEKEDILKLLDEKE